jgi:anti-sigma factor RsiW
MTTTHALTCREIVELVTDYLEGTMPAPVRRRFQEHLAGCQGCSHYLEQMRATIRLTGMLSEDSLPPELKEALLEAFRDFDAG